MAKVYTQADEKISFRVVTASGIAVDASSKGSVPAGIRSAFGWLTPKRREWVLQNLKADHEAQLVREAERTTQPNPSTTES